MSGLTRKPVVASFGLRAVGPCFAVAALAVTAGCAGNPPPAPPPSPVTASGAEAGLLPGDAVRVRIWREEDLSGDFQVDAEGVVVLPLLGVRRVSGIEPAALERRLADEYGEFLENPSIEVTALLRIAQLGEVRWPGLYTVDATVTLADALALAGGVTPEGDPGDIRLVRDGEVIQQSLRPEMLREPLALRSGDRIVVGRRSWLNRNFPLLSVGVGTVTAAVAALIISGS